MNKKLNTDNISSSFQAIKQHINVLANNQAFNSDCSKNENIANQLLDTLKDIETIIEAFETNAKPITKKTNRTLSVYWIIPIIILQLIIGLAVFKQLT